MQNFCILTNTVAYVINNFFPFLIWHLSWQFFFSLFLRRDWPITIPCFAKFSKQQKIRLELCLYHTVYHSPIEIIQTVYFTTFRMYGLKLTLNALSWKCRNSLRSPVTLFNSRLTKKTGCRGALHMALFQTAWVIRGLNRDLRRDLRYT